MTVYVFSLPKGGTGKSSTAAELALRLAARGRRTLAMDLDQQGNYSKRLGILESTPVEVTAADVLAGRADPTPENLPNPRENVWVAVGASDLTDLESAGIADLVVALAHTDMSAWDDVVIDTSPSAGVLMQAGLVPADVIIAPVQCAVEAWEQLTRLEKILELKLRRIKPGAAVRWIIPTLYDKRRRLDNEVVASLREHHGAKVTRATIRETVLVKDSYNSHQPVSEYDPTAEVTSDVLAVVDQILEETR